MKTTHAIGLALIMWWLLLGACYVVIPPSPDQFELQYVAERMLAGQTLYVDVIDMNWPGCFWLHAMTAWYVPEGFYPWRGLDYAFMITATVVGARLLRRQSNSHTALFWLVLYPLLYLTATGQWFAGQRDIICGHLLIITIVLHLNGWERNALWWSMATGVMIAITMLVKPSLALAGPALALHGLLTRPANVGWLRAATHVLVMGAAAAASVLGGFGVVWFQGAGLSDIWECALVYNAVTQGWEAATLMELIVRGWGWLLHSWHWIALTAVIGFFTFSQSPAGRRIHALFVTLLLVGFGSYWGQGKAYAYHLGVVFTTMCYFSALGLGTCWHSVCAERWVLRWLSRMVLGLVVLGGFAKIANLQPQAAYLVGFRSWETLMAEYTAGAATMKEVGELIERLQSEVAPEQPIFVWGTESVINHLTGSPQPTRFYYGPLLVNARPPLPMADRWNDLFEQDLAENPPAACVISLPLQAQAQRLDAPVAQKVEAVLRDFRLIGRFGELELYFRDTSEQLTEGENSGR